MCCNLFGTGDPQHLSLVIFVCLFVCLFFSPQETYLMEIIFDLKKLKFVSIPHLVTLGFGSRIKEQYWGEE